MNKSQKQLIREKFETKEWNHWSSFQSKFVRLPDSIKKEIADFWLNELDLAIKQTEERTVKVINEHINIEQRTHGIGSHSDDYGGESDLPCDCDEKERNYKISALESLKKRFLSP